GRTVRVEFPVLRTALVGDREAGGDLRGAFVSSSRSRGPARLPFVATPVAGPDPGLLAPRAVGEPIDLGEARTTWRLEVAGALARLELEQLAPGAFQGTLTFADGNICYVAGVGRGDRLVVSGFDGAAPYRLALAL